MRNRQVGPGDATQVLAEVVSRIRYKPGWTFELAEIDRGQGSEGLTLMIGATVPNSIDDGAVGILHLMPVMPAAYDQETWTRWVMDQILLIEQHEALEWFQVGDARPFFPEHAPGRNPYTIAQVKTREQVEARALPWNGGRPTDTHFA